MESPLSWTDVQSPTTFLSPPTPMNRQAADDVVNRLSLMLNDFPYGLPSGTSLGVGGALAAAEETMRMMLYTLPLREGDQKAEYRYNLFNSGLQMFSILRFHFFMGGEQSLAKRPESYQRLHAGCRLALQLIRSVQLLAETHAVRRGGRRAGLRMCLKMEVLKLTLRLVMRQCSPFAIYVDPETLHAENLLRPPNLPLAAPPEGIPLLARMLLASPEEFKQMTRRVFLGGPSLTSQEQVGEALYLLRPVVHCAVLSYGWKSAHWRQWALASGMDFLGCWLLMSREVTARRATSGEEREGAVEVTELMRRRRDLLGVGLLRPPLFDKMLRRFIGGVEGVVRRVPLLNMCNFFGLMLSNRRYYYAASQWGLGKE